MVLSVILCFPSVRADWISINGGGTTELVITPSTEIEGFFWGLSPAPAPVVVPPGGGSFPFPPIKPPLPERHEEVGAPYDVQILVGDAHYEPGQNVSVRIRVNNTGNKTDADAVLGYYLLSPNGTAYDWATETNLEVDPGVTTYERTLVLPLRASLGEWKAYAIYNVSRLNPIPAMDTVSVDRTPWRMNWFMAIVLGLLIVGVLAFAIGRSLGRKAAFREAEELTGEDEEDDEEAES